MKATIFFIALIWVNISIFGQTVFKETGSIDDYSDYIPFNLSKNYNYFRGIYTQSEINQDGNITGMSLFFYPNSDIDYVNLVEIYVKVSSSQGFSDNIFDVVNWEKVYSGSIKDIEEGWFTFIFNSPISITSGQNLFVAIKQGYQMESDGSLMVAVQGAEESQSQYLNTNKESDMSLEGSTVKPVLKLEFEGFHPQAGNQIYAPLNTPVILGGEPPILGISEGVQITWSPVDNMNSPSLGNPTVLANGNSYTLSATREEEESSSTCNVYKYNDLIVDFKVNTTVYLNNGVSLMFYDSPGDDDESSVTYDNGLDYNIKFVGTGANSRIVAEISYFSIENKYDYLHVHDGGMGEQLLTSLTGEQSGITLNSSGTSMTFNFKSNGLKNANGWVITVMAVDATDCGVQMGTTTLENYTESLNSGEATLGCEVTYPGSSFVGWQRRNKFSDNWEDFSGDQNACNTGLVNTSTIYRAKISNSGCPDFGYSNSVEYLTGNNFYVNDELTGSDVFTSSTGDDSNDGLTKSTPKLTINSMLAADYYFKPGDTIFIDNGNYDEGVIIAEIPYTSGYYFTLFGAGRGKTKVISTQELKAFDIFMASSVSISNLSMISNESVPSLGIEDCEGVNISGCYIHNSGSGVTVIVSDAGGIKFTDNIVVNEGTEQSALFFTGNNTNFEVSRNWINGGVGSISISENYVQSSITSNFLSNSSIGLTINSRPGEQLNVYNNSFYSSTACININGDGELDNVNVVNNILSTTAGSTGSYCLSANDIPTFGEFDYNLLYNPASNGSIALLGSTSYSFATLKNITIASIGNNVNSITGDPQYFFPDEGNLVVNTTSVVSGKGKPGLVTLDINAFETQGNIGASNGYSQYNDVFGNLSMEKTLDFIDTRNMKLNFKYLKENNEVNGSELAWNIINSRSTIVESSTNSNQNLYPTLGTNYLTINLCSINNLTKFNTLVVTNVKNEKFYLNFRVNSLWYLTSCAISSQNSTL